ncbi:uncharacterized protein LOC143292013 [Babylonia areolata]|uniref:uncharacterized protein LOC143292013 n=1 Tax=Babylonia areolata TaxID=304850 RepID=UPI003FD1BACE
MGCDAVTLRHSVCVVCLVVGWGLVIAGVASPWWRVVDEELHGRHEGLWQQCVRLGKYDKTCHFSQRSTALWRAVQVVNGAAVVVLTFAVVCLLSEALCCPPPPSHCPAPCRLPPSFFAALLGGLASLVGDLLYVGYTEYHTSPLLHEHVHHWSFALAVGGSCFSLFAAIVIAVTARFYIPDDSSLPARRRGRQHWSDHELTRTNTGQTESSWRYYPSPDRDPRRRPSRLHFVNHGSRGPPHPYHVRSMGGGAHVGDPYGGWYGPRPFHGPRRYHDGASYREQCHEVVEQQVRTYPSLKELEAEYGADNSLGPLSPLEAHHRSQTPTAPEFSDPRPSTRYSSSGEELPGYFSPRDSPLPPLPEEPEGGDGGQDRPVGPPNEAMRKTPASDMSTQTHTERATSAGSSIRTGSTTPRQVQFVDDRGWDHVSESWSSRGTGRAHVFPAVRQPALDGWERSHVSAHQHRAGRPPGAPPGHHPERTEVVRRTSAAGRHRDHLMPTRHVQHGIDPRQMDDVEMAAAFRGHPGSGPRPFRPPSRRRPPLLESAHGHYGPWWGHWDRPPAQRRVVVKARRGAPYDGYDYF